jgi:hypothetical protein
MKAQSECLERLILKWFQIGSIARSRGSRGAIYRHSGWWQLQAISIMWTFAASLHSGLQYLVPSATLHLQLSRAHLLVFASSAISITSHNNYTSLSETSFDSMVFVVKVGHWWTGISWRRNGKSRINSLLLT